MKAGGGTPGEETSETMPVEAQESVVDLPEFRLVRRAQRGDTGAFEQIYRENVGRVFAICLRMTADAGRAEELTQDVFVRVWEKIGTFGAKSAFSSWLYRLTANLVVDSMRSTKRRSARESSTDDPAAWEEPGPVKDPGTGLDLEAAIASLPPGARTVFVLHDVEGFRHEEIAEIAGMAEGTSKAQLHRARRLLRERLGP